MSKTCPLCYLQGGGVGGLFLAPQSQFLQAGRPGSSFEGHIFPPTKIIPRVNQKSKSISIGLSSHAINSHQVQVGTRPEGKLSSKLCRQGNHFCLGNFQWCQVYLAFSSFSVLQAAKAWHTTQSCQLLTRKREQILHRCNANFLQMWQTYKTNVKS